MPVLLKELMTYEYRQIFQYIFSVINLTAQKFMATPIELLKTIVVFCFPPATF